MKKLILSAFFVLILFFLVVSYIIAISEDIIYGLCLVNMMIIPFCLGIIMPVMVDPPVKLGLWFLLTLAIVPAVYFGLPIIAFIFGWLIIEFVSHLGHPKKSYNF